MRRTTMSRAALAALVAAAGLLPGRAADAQEIVVRLGGPGAATGVAVDGQIQIPIVVDMTSGDEAVARVSAGMSWNTAQFDFVSAEPGPFGTVTLNQANVAAGVFRAAMHNAEATTEPFTLATVTLQATAPEGTNAPLGLAVMGIGDADARDLSLLTASEGVFLCVGATGLWGDVNGDGALDILDAQQVARFSVGLSVMDADALGSAADVNDDGRINILDAQQVARFAVGLAGENSRVGELLGAGCPAPTTDGLRLDPQRLQMAVDDVTTVVTVATSEGSDVAWPGGAVTWWSTDPSVVSIAPLDASSAELTAGSSAGTAYILATLDGLLAPAARITVTTGTVCNDIADYVQGATGPAETVGGSLGEAGDCLDGEWYVDAWELTLAEAQAVQVDLLSDALDAFLYVLDAQGDLVAQDDDSGEGTDARLTMEFDAGTYYLMVSSALELEAGEYTLSTTPGAVEPEPCSTLNQFVVGGIAPGSTESGTLDENDCVLDDGTLAEAWELALTGTTDVQIDLESLDFNAFLLLVDEAGNTLAVNDNGGGDGDAMLARQLDAGTYYLFANTFAPGETGDYTISLSLSDVGPSCVDIGAFTVGFIGVGEVRDNALTTDDCLNGDWYTDVWTLELASTQLLRMDLSSGDFDAHLIVLNDALESVAEDDDGGEGTDARVVVELEPGTYHIAASSTFGYEVGEYHLAVSSAYGSGSDCATALNFLVGSIAVNGSESGSLGAEDCLMEETYFAEAWELTLDAETGVQIDLASADPGLDPFLVLTDAAGVLVADDNDTGPDTDAMIARTLPAGTYYIYASTNGAGETGVYDLAVTEAAVGPSCSTIGEFLQGGVALNGSVGGTLDTSDCLSGDWYTEAWALDLTESTLVQFDVQSADFAASFRVFDGNLELLAQNSVDNPGETATTSLALDAGTYYVLPSTLSAYETGVYTLDVSESPPNMCGSIEEFLAGSVSVNAMVSGSLEASDCAFEDGTYADAWQLDIGSTMTVQIDLASTEFDTYLLVWDHSGTLVQQNDDGGDGTNSQIVMELTAGTYYIVANSYGPGETGGYDLQVTN